MQSVLTVEVLETGLIVDAALSAALDIDINPGIKVDKAKQLMAPKTMGTVVIPLAEIPVEVTITLEYVAIIHLVRLGSLFIQCIV